jgi:hypothetical protein
MMMMMTNHSQDNAAHQQQNASPQSIADYLAQLLKDRKQLAALPNVFTHLERLLDEGKWNICKKERGKKNKVIECINVCLQLLSSVCYIFMYLYLRYLM